MPNRPILGFLALCLSMSVFYPSCTIPEKPVTKEEAAALAEKITRSIDHHNALLLDKIFDEQAFAKRAASEARRPLNKDFVAGAVEGIKKAHFGQQVVQSIGGNGSYELVKQYEKGGRQHLLFRLRGNNSVNYHDFELEKKEEDVKAIDVYIYMSGENLSKTFGDALLMMQEQMPDMSKADMEVINKMKEIKILVSQKEYEKANEYYQSVPRSYQRQKIFQLVHVQIASGLGNDQYAKALTEYRDLFPNDPNMYLMSIDAYVLEKDYPKALESINKLDSLIDKDPFQDYYRGLMYKLMNDTANTVVCFERLHRNMPRFGDGSIELITVYTKTGALDKAAKVLAKAKEDKSLTPEIAERLYLLHPDLRKAAAKAP